MKKEFGGAAPIFRVRDVRASLGYYVDVLGFTVNWDEGGMVSVSSGDTTLFLTEWDQHQKDFDNLKDQVVVFRREFRDFVPEFRDFAKSPLARR